MAKVTGKEIGTIDVKRFYLPGLRVEVECKECKKPMVKDLAQEYLTYPPVNQPFPFTVYCTDCDKPIALTLIFEAQLKIVEQTDC
jgi:hypothetical protein